MRDLVNHHRCGFSHGGRKEGRKEVAVANWNANPGERWWSIGRKIGFSYFFSFSFHNRVTWQEVSYCNKKTKKHKSPSCFLSSQWCHIFIIPSPTQWDKQEVSLIKQDIYRREGRRRRRGWIQFHSKKQSLSRGIRYLDQLLISLERAKKSRPTVKTVTRADQLFSRRFWLTREVEWCQEGGRLEPFNDYFRLSPNMNQEIERRRQRKREWARGGKSRCVLQRPK